MLRTKIISTKLMGVVMLLSGVAASSCNDNKSETSTSTSTTDTTAVMKIDSSSAINTMGGDTSAVNSSTTSNAVMDTAGKAKPNVAKKGLKGRTTITVPTKGSGAMEMDNTGVYSNVEYLPSYPGGNKGLQKFFDDNLQYPASASDDGVEGTVNVSFVVDENGKLSSPQVQGQNLGYGLETEALRVINKMPPWNPGKLKGKNVKTRFTLPVVFQLY